MVFILSGCISRFFFYYCDKVPMKSNFKEGRVALGSWVLRTQSIVVGKARMQEREAAGHMAPTVRNQRETEGWCSAHFLLFRSVWDPSLSDSATHIHSESSPISSAWQETPSQTCPVVCLQIWSTVNTSHHGDQGPAKMEMGDKDARDDWQLVPCAAS